MTFPPHHPFRSAEARERFLARYDERAARWPVPCEGRTIETSLGRTFVRVSGRAGAPPLVLLHGISGSSLQWGPNIAKLAERFEVFAIDGIHDCGQSVYSRLAKEGYDYAYWLDEVATGLGIRSEFALAGLSYGGWIASQYGLRYPRRVRGLVLVAPANTVLPIVVKWMARAILTALPIPWLTRNFMQWMLADTAAKGEEGRKLVEEVIEDSYLAARCFAWKPTAQPTVLRDEELQALPRPTFLILGENETIYSAKDAIARVKRVAPHIQTELLPNAGHDLTLVQADRFNALLLSWLGEGATTATATG
ncbi:alpha/beta fold hydrolase [Polyangium jinanense]|uniref:Alpha/beta hydrolase n=1 Tax=Polyangium jinanense TaxID=2829994 RepID=A0A9X3X745_9BACT|nr:alpha/beta hydrolase [Polyangium jinanense]MDC3959082.1 alpha/beta hydrolase [Polyangium jinanense]MDC3983995.1 alpha/beta hydrolase [Polyangium jinanense]